VGFSCVTKNFVIGFTLSFLALPLPPSLRAQVEMSVEKSKIKAVTLPSADAGNVVGCTLQEGFNGRLISDGCKRRFRAVWAGIRAALSDADIEAARRIEADAKRRTVNWPGR
jgi:hypothetical protein